MAPVLELSLPVLGKAVMSPKYKSRRAPGGELLRKQVAPETILHIYPHITPIQTSKVFPESRLYQEKGKRKDSLLRIQGLVSRSRGNRPVRRSVYYFFSEEREVRGPI